MADHTSSPSASAAHTRDLLRLTLVPGLGPVLIRRLIEQFRSPAVVLGLSASGLEQVDKIGPKRSADIVAAFAASADLAERELERCAQTGVRLISQQDDEYPPLLKEIPGAPPLLYVKGQLDHAGRDRFTLAVVGSRKCTAYGVEQAERFSTVIASAGITIVSGGAKGIDAAAHRAALRAKGRTIAVLGCGHAQCYPPEHAEMYEKIAQTGAVISELPLDTPPNPENFPARNRIISGMSLGVLVIEAALRSGALITARLAAEEHHREVMVVPGRVDSAASQGSHELIKSGGAHLVTEPGEVMQLIERPAEHAHQGTHESRYTDAGLFAANQEKQERQARIKKVVGLTPEQATLLEMLETAQTLDQLVARSGRPVAAIRGDLTILEIHKRIKRAGSQFVANG
ncbi:MAG: DNA-processing protein DprA [Planctomycetes bacterium]|nr:DNA-processing protein DprA [Planctomycetota bacterium]